MKYLVNIVLISLLLGSCTLNQARIVVGEIIIPALKWVVVTFLDDEPLEGKQKGSVRRQIEADFDDDGITERAWLTCPGGAADKCWSAKRTDKLKVGYRLEDLKQMEPSAMEVDGHGVPISIERQAEYEVTATKVNN